MFVSRSGSLVRAPVMLTLAVGVLCGFVSASPAAQSVVVASDAGTSLRTPEQYGAVGDGQADDTGALQRALDSVPSGGTLQLQAGSTYRHTQVLVARVPGESIVGAGALLATNPANSSFWIAADDITVKDVTFRTVSTTQRWSAFEQMGVRIVGVSGTVLRSINVVGSAAAGIYVGESCCTGRTTASSHFLLDHVSVSGTRADGIHMTGGSNNGVVRDATVSDTGDDGIAVVSYVADGAVCNHITIESPTVRTTNWGRGVSVVGGEHITYTDVNVSRSDAAAVYIANEGAPFDTYSSRYITVAGGSVSQANTNPSISHGAIMIYSGREGYTVSDVAVSGLHVADTRTSAPWQVGISSSGGQVEGITIQGLTITGGGPSTFATNVPGGAYSAIGWLVNGQAISDHR